MSILKRPLGKSGFSVAPLAFGGNVFGWTADESTSFRLLDRFVERGFNLIDTADVYTRWIPGHQGGESESIIGKWLKKSGKRDKVVIATKVGFDMDPTKAGMWSDTRCLKKDSILKAVEGSLKRLQIETIDLYQTHIDDLDTPVEETMEALDSLVRQGKVRAIGASQYKPERLIKSLTFAEKNRLTLYTCLQPGYNLYDREDYERDLQPIVEKYGLGVITYFSLAGGFLTGKYRTEQDLSKSARGQGIVKAKYFNEKGLRIVRALDQVAERVNAPLSTIALAWILSNPTITAPIASATNLEQLDEILRAPELKLDPESLALLNGNAVN
jgi:aryl-alcohol dehydrogenase-like predicted oxidoreductase